jgi:hypothetical protein
MSEDYDMPAPFAAASAAAWVRRGLLIPTPTVHSWALTHATLPTVEPIDDMHLHVYYSPRDARGRAYIARATVEVRAPGELRVSDHDADPILRPGPLGTFDDSGVNVSCIVDSEKGTLLYYTGWSLGQSVPFYFYGGVALRQHGQREFERVSLAPLLERCSVDPYLSGSPWVLREGGLWRMWYASGTKWDIVDAMPRHHYHLRYAESTDGLAWRRDGRVIIDYADSAEYALARPCVVRDEDCYRMWFSARGDSYRLGYAESADGVNWDRDDARAGLPLAEEGWDSEMVAYPTVFDAGGVRYLLYNGNGYGATGIGYATMDA